MDANKVFERYKARIVVKGYAQIAGMEFEEIFALVVRIESIRVLLPISAHRNLYTQHVDCKNAFLNSDSDVELYVQQPEGFINHRYHHRVLKLNKSLYGLKQAPRIWYLLLCSVVCDILGFTAVETDMSIYICGTLIIAAHVDDILIFAPSQADCHKIYEQLSRHFKIVDKGHVKSFLGLNISRDWEKRTITIDQCGYIDRIIHNFGMTDAIPARTPLPSSLPLLKATSSDKRCDQLQYQRLIGSLNHLAVFTRPDISFAVSHLSQFNSDPTTTYMKAAKHVLHYLKRTRFFCITYGYAEYLYILGFSDEV